MVNCKNCGAPLTLDDAYCPHCGTPNEEAIEHIEKLKALDKDYEKTRNEVMSEAKKSYRGYNLLVILVVLLLANVMLFILYNRSYEISEKIVSARQDRSQIEAAMRDYLENEDYLEFVTYTDKYAISYRDYEEFIPIINLAYDYKQIVKDVSHYHTVKDNYADPLTRACTDLEDYLYDLKNYNRRDDYSDYTRKNIEKLDKQCRSFLKSYMYLKDTDMEELEEMTSSEIVTLVMERINDEKEKQMD